MSTVAKVADGARVLAVLLDGAAYGKDGVEAWSSNGLTRSMMTTSRGSASSRSTSFFSKGKWLHSEGPRIAKSALPVTCDQYEAIRPSKPYE